MKGFILNNMIQRFNSCCVKNEWHTISHHGTMHLQMYVAVKGPQRKQSSAQWVCSCITLFLAHSSMKAPIMTKTGTWYIKCCRLPRTIRSSELNPFGRHIDPSKWIWHWQPCHFTFSNLLKTSVGNLPKHLEINFVQTGCQFDTLSSNYYLHLLSAGQMKIHFCNEDQLVE